jgi:uncharacterized membrane protein YiaA
MHFFVLLKSLSEAATVREFLVRGCFCILVAQWFAAVLECCAYLSCRLLMAAFGAFTATRLLAEKEGDLRLGAQSVVKLAMMSVLLSLGNDLVGHGDSVAVGIRVVLCVAAAATLPQSVAGRLAGAPEVEVR